MVIHADKKSLHTGKKPQLYISWASLVFGILVAVTIVAAFIINGYKGKLFFLIITLCGALGGIVYTTRSHTIEVPHIELKDLNTYSLGFLSDIVGGVGGAYVIFMILPFDFQDPPAIKMDSTVSQSLAQEFQQIRALIQVIAVSMVGGYGGRAIMEKVQDTLSLKIQGVAVRQKNVEVRQEMLERKATEDMEDLRREYSSKIDQINRNDAAKSIIAKILDVNYKPSQAEWNELETVIGEAYKSMGCDLCDQIYYRVKDIRAEHALELIGLLNKNLVIDGSQQGFNAFFQANRQTLARIADIMQKAAKVFRLLAETTSEAPIHRYYACWAYSEKDLLYATNTHIDNTKQWTFIVGLLDKAISIRDAFGLSEPEQYALDVIMENFGYYEMNKAICLIEIDASYRSVLDIQSSSKTREDIIGLLKYAYAASDSRGQSLETIFPVALWMLKNNVEKDSLCQK
jgi:hypothetical protein